MEFFNDLLTVVFNAKTKKIKRDICGVVTFKSGFDLVSSIFFFFRLIN